MNIVILAGVMQREPEYKMTSSGMGYARFTIRVPGTTKDKETGKYLSEFIKCVAFGKTADTIANYIHEKDTFVLRGALRNSEYPDKKTGEKRTSLDVIVDSVDLPPRKSAPANNYGGAIASEEMMF